MAMNLDAVLRIAAKVVGLEEVTRLEKSIVNLDKSATAAKQGFKGVVDSSAWQGAAVAAAGIGVALGVSVKAAIDFESAMADVRKVVPGLDSAEGFKAMSQEILNMSKELPVSAKGLAEIMAAAGQAGIAKEELADFTRQAAQMGIAFDISAAEAGEAMAKLRTSLGLDQRQVVDLADAMNYLSNNMASSAAEVTQFMLRAGAMGKQVALTTEQTAAFGSAMIAAGAPPEVAATSFNNLIRALTKGESATARQSEAFQRLGLDVVGVAKSMQIDAVGTIRDVFLRISKMPAEMRVSTISEIFGDEARALTPLITNMALFEQSMGLVGDRSKYAGSMLAEFETRSATSANQFQILQNNLEALAIAIGNGLLPAINLVLKALTPVIGFISDMANRFPLLTAAITALVAAFAGLVLLAPFIVSFITLLGQLAGLKLGATIAGWAAAILPLKAAFAGFLAWASGTLIPGLLAIFSGPVGWTVLAVAAVVAMAIAFRKPLGDFANWLWNWGEPIRKFWIGLWDGAVSNAKKSFGVIGDVFKSVARTFDEWVIKPISSAWAALTQLLPRAMQNVASSVQSTWTSLINAVKGVIRGLLQSVVNSLNAVGSQVNRLIGAYNRLPSADIPFVPTLSVPAFAKGGVVSGPTLAMVGEGGEPEYIIPQSKMARASMNYLNGARGSAVIPAYAQGGYIGGNAQINVTTGPVMQQGGQQYVSMADLEKAMRKTADGIYASLRTPAGRYAVGLR
jgi:TP901 family phage tail tape measure protein